MNVGSSKQQQGRQRLDRRNKCSDDGDGRGPERAKMERPGKPTKGTDHGHTPCHAYALPSALSCFAARSLSLSPAGGVPKKLRAAYMRHALPSYYYYCYPRSQPRSHAILLQLMCIGCFLSRASQYEPSKP